MITEYTKADPVKVVDDEFGEYEIDYQDNVDGIIELDNEIEMIEDILEEMLTQTPFSSFILKDTLYKGYGLLGFGVGVLILSLGIAFVKQTFHILIELLPVIIPFSLLTIGFPIVAIARTKKRIKQESIQQSQIDYLKEKLAKKKEKKSILQNNKAKTVESTNETISLLDIIEEKRALLLTELSLLLAYKSNMEAYRQGYLNGTLNDLVPKEEEQAIVRKLIERDLKRAA